MGWRHDLKNIIVPDSGQSMKGRTWIFFLRGWGLVSLLQVGVEGLNGSIGVGYPSVGGHLHWQHVCYPWWTWFAQSAFTFTWMCFCYRRLVPLFARGRLHTGDSQVKRKKSSRSFNLQFRTKYFWWFCWSLLSYWAWN